MRRGNDSLIMLDDAQNVVAVNLGSDYCAEHEWGIKKTREALGIDDTKVGLQKRSVTQTPPELVWYEGTADVYSDVSGKRTAQRYEGFWLKSWSGAKEPHEISFGRGSALATAWSDGDFGAFSNDVKQIEQLREIYNALVTKDAVVWLGGRGVFKNAGLVIAIAHRLSNDVTESWLRQDNERTQLLEDAKKTGVEARLKAAKKGFYALAPRRDKDGSVVFWLNPFDQLDNNYGQFTVQELDEWIVGKGPIPMKKKERT